ncbi:MAG: efflux RND transporter periplasmic adaptor subunit [Terracidiphilus sp.]|jgi:multidrug efflux system membrane fusion protein
MSGVNDEFGVQHIGADHQLPPAHPWYRERWVLWTGALLLLIIAAIMIVIIHKNDAKAAAAKRAQAAVKPSVTVTIAPTTKGDIGIYLDAIGTVTPVNTTSITAQANGVLTAVHYSEGQFVQKGDPLIDIDPRPYQATLLQAEGTLERDSNILAQAQMDLDRYRIAWSQNSINKQLLDDQEKIVLQDQGTVKNDQGAVNYDQVQLSYCKITAPIAGRVGLRLVDPGNVVQATGSTVLVVITQVQPTTVVFTLAEDSLGQVQARMRKVHTLPVDAWDRSQANKIASGKLQTIDNQIDTTTGTVKLRALFDNKNGALFPNQFVNTRLLVNTLKGVTLVPNAAVQHNGQIEFLYVIANGTASVRNIKTGVADGGMIAVQGINPDEIVATSSFDKLQEGSKVVVSKQAAPTNSTEGNAP